MSMETEDLRRRLKKAERDLVNSKEECIHLTTNTQALEREVYLVEDEIIISVFLVQLNQISLYIL